MENINIETRNNSAFITVPYDADFIALFKKRVGRRIWHNDSKEWEILPDDIPIVRQTMIEIFGYTDEERETVAVTVDFGSETIEWADRKPVRIAGTLIAAASGRDSGVRLREASLLSGGFDSGGSSRYWHVIIKPETKIRTVCSKAALDRLEKDGNTWIYEEPIRISPVEQNQAHVVIEALKAERNKLLARISQIDVLIGEDN